MFGEACRAPDDASASERCGSLLRFSLKGDIVDRLLVGYDGSVPGREAVRMSAILAKRLGATLTVLTVGHVEEASLPIAEEGADIARALGVDPDVRVELGDPVNALVDIIEREGYDLAVVGHRGLGGLKGLLVGSVAKKLATVASCPVLIVRGTAREEIKKILAAVDGSEHASRALEAATVLAKVFDARITLLNVLNPQLLALAKDGPAMHYLWLTLQREGIEAMEKASEICKTAGVSYDSKQTVGQPAHVICTTAQEGGYDLVAVGRRGVTGIGRLVLGSVSDEVVAKASPLVLLSSEHATDGSQVT